MSAPVLPSDFEEVIPDSTSSKCAAFIKVLLRFPVLVWKLVAYMFDEDGNPTSDFLRSIQATGTFEFAAAELAEDGRLLCDGRAVSRTTYSALYGVIGTAFGVGDGSTTFNLPDCQDRMMLGQSATRLGTTTGDGKLTMDNIPEHSHLLANNTENLTVEIINSADDYITVQGVGDSDSNYRYALAPTTGGAPNVGRVGLTGETDPDPVYPPYLSVWIYIRT